MMKRMGNNKKGVTLIELIVVCAIAVIIISAASAVMVTGIKSYNANVTSTVSQQNLRTAMTKVTKLVRNAPAGAVSITGSKVLTVSAKNFTVSGGMLMHGGAVIAENISAIQADYKDASHKTIQVDLTAKDGTKLSTQIRVN